MAKTRLARPTALVGMKGTFCAIRDTPSQGNKDLCRRARSAGSQPSSGPQMTAAKADKPPLKTGCSGQSCSNGMLGVTAAAGARSQPARQLPKASDPANSSRRRDLTIVIAMAAPCRAALAAMHSVPTRAPGWGQDPQAAPFLAARCLLTGPTMPLCLSAGTCAAKIGAADQLAQFLEVDEIVGLAAQVICDHCRLAADG
jgi:hypothetical protein